MLIGEVARRSGVSPRMLRHYDRLGLVRPTGRTVGNYREYSDEDIRRIFHVESLRSLGLSLRQIASALEDPDFTPAALVSDLIRWTEERLEREQELLQRLRAVDATAPSGWPDVLRIVELMHGLDSPDAARRQQAVLAPSDNVPVPVELLAGAVLTEGDPHVAGALRWALARAGDDSLDSLASGLHSDDVNIRRRAVLAIAELTSPPSPSASPNTSSSPPGSGPAVSAPPGSVSPGSAMAGSASVGSASVGSASVGSASVGSASVGSASVGSASVGSASVGSASGGSATGGLGAPEFSPAGVTAVLTDALGDEDLVVRRNAALALGKRGVTAAVPVLVGMVVEGINDVEAAEALGALAAEPSCGQQILDDLVDALAVPDASAAVRIRLTQALVEMPGPGPVEVLRGLTRDEDRSVALVASAFVELRLAG